MENREFKSRIKQNIGFIIRLILTVVCLSFILVKIDIEQLIISIRAMDEKYVLLAVIFLFPNFFLKFYKWNLFLHSNNLRIPFIDVCKSYLVGLAFGVLTPARVGELGRVLLFRKAEKFQASGIVIIDKLFDLLGITLLSLWGIKVFGGNITFSLFLMLCVSFVLFLVHGGRFLRPLDRIIRKLPWEDQINRILWGFRQLNWKLTTKGIVLTVAMFNVVILQFHFLILAFEAFTFKNTFLVSPIIILTNILPITIGGIGVREGASAILLSHFGILKEVAVSAAFMLFIINVLIPAIVGFLMLPGLKNGTLKNLDIPKS